MSDVGVQEECEPSYAESDAENLKDCDPSRSESSCASYCMSQGSDADYCHVLALYFNCNVIHVVYSLLVCCHNEFN